MVISLQFLCDSFYVKDKPPFLKYISTVSQATALSLWIQEKFLTAQEQLIV